jgi:dehydrogenase/reductase SDR family protein 4
MNRLPGKVALVTGASRGIGRAIAETFAREGAFVVICGRRQDTLDAVAQEIGPRVMPVACHVGHPEDIRKLVETTLAEFGRIDILINNAATNVAQGPCLQTTDAQFDKMIDINLKSAFRLTNAVAPAMCEKRSGAVVNIASISGLRPQHHGMLYSMTKAALIMMTQSYALELGPQGVRVNAIAPGLVQTKLSEFYWKDGTTKPLGQPREIAEIALMLASDDASFMTGQTLVVDGGYTLGAL